MRRHIAVITFVLLTAGLLAGCSSVQAGSPIYLLSQNRSWQTPVAWGSSLEAST
jgi:hypothetical protein